MGIRRQVRPDQGAMTPTITEAPCVPVPARACDAHVHVFDPQRFAYVTPRRFTPGTANVSQLREHLRRTGAAGAVLVQPSVYGDHHDCLLNALAALEGTGRGVCVVSERTSRKELAALDAAGVRGARINLVVDHQENIRHALALVNSVEARIPAHWHVQLHVRLGMLRALAGHLRASGRTYVLDHLGLPDIEAGIHGAHWQFLLELLAQGQLYVKLSAPYLSSRTGEPYDDLRPFAKTLFDLRSDRVLWGSNWPHTQGTHRSAEPDLNQVEPFRQEDDRRWRHTCALWAGDQAACVLGGNAALFYGL